MAIPLPPTSGFSFSGLVQQAQGAVATRTVMWSKLIDTGGNLAINLTVAVLILVVTVWAAGWAAKLTRQGLGRVGFHHRPDAPFCVQWSRPGSARRYRIEMT